MSIHVIVYNLILITSTNLSFNQQGKDLFHKYSKKLLQTIASDLGYDRNSYELRGNKAGPAVSGEITLHCDDLYIQLSEDHILYRSCRDRKDYSGGPNHFLQYNDLQDYYDSLERFKEVRR